MNQRKTYLLCVFIDTPQQEHARIKTAIERISDKDFEFVHLNKSCIALLFNTDKEPGQIEAALGEGALNSDRRFIMEVGARWQTFGLNKAAFWLKHHLIS